MLFYFNFRRDNQKKFPMSIATMRRETKRAYLRLCPEKGQKKKSNSKGQKKRTSKRVPMHR